MSCCGKPVFLLTIVCDTYSDHEQNVRFYWNVIELKRNYRTQKLHIASVNGRNSINRDLGASDGVNHFKRCTFLSLFLSSINWPWHPILCFVLLSNVSCARFSESCFSTIATCQLISNSNLSLRNSGKCKPNHATKTKEWMRNTEINFAENTQLSSNNCNASINNKIQNAERVRDKTTRWSKEIKNEREKMV